MAKATSGALVETSAVFNPSLGGGPSVQPVAAVAMVVQVASQENAQHHSKQNLPGQAEFYIFHMNDFLNGAPFPVQKRENVTYCQGMNCVALVCRFF